MPSVFICDQRLSAILSSIAISAKEEATRASAKPGWATAGASVCLYVFIDKYFCYGPIV